MSASDAIWACGTAFVLAVSARGQIGEWIQQPVSGPPARSDHGMAFDRSRGVGVVCAGRWDLSNRRYDTWEWNGVLWRERASFGPGGRFRAPMVFHEERRVTLFYGGWWSDCPNCGLLSKETWVWDGAVWAGPGVGPGQREGHAMVYDPCRGVTLLFGGQLENEFSIFVGDDTWEWNGVSWAQQHVRGPIARNGHGLAFDTRRGVAVLFGGQDQNGLPLGDTWEYDGKGWSRVCTTGPAPRAWHGMVYHEGRGAVVLFGGATDAFRPALTFGDTWEWDGAAWRELVIPASPPARFGHGMIYDSVRDRILLYGGRDGSEVVVDDTWELCLPPACYADCDTSTGVNALDIFDFLCFQNRYAAGAPYACDCDTGSGPGVCDVFDFLCFQNAYAAGCP